METKIFEEHLSQMTKPEVNVLKHEEELAAALLKVKDQSVVSLWWLSIPLYLIAAFLMKSGFMPNTTLTSNIHQFTEQNKITSRIIYVALPIILVCINLISIKKYYVTTGSLYSFRKLLNVWFNLVIIAVSIFLMFIYLF